MLRKVQAVNPLDNNGDVTRGSTQMSEEVGERGCHLLIHTYIYVADPHIVTDRAQKGQ